MITRKPVIHAFNSNHHARPKSKPPIGNTYKVFKASNLVDTRVKTTYQNKEADSDDNEETRSNWRYQPPRVLNRFRQQTKDFLKNLDQKKLSLVNKERESKIVHNQEDIQFPKVDHIRQEMKMRDFYPVTNLLEHSENQFESKLEKVNNLGSKFEKKKDYVVERQDRKTEVKTIILANPHIVRQQFNRSQENQPKQLNPTHFNFKESSKIPENNSKKIRRVIYRKGETIVRASPHKVVRSVSPLLRKKNANYQQIIRQTSEIPSRKSKTSKQYLNGIKSEIRKPDNQHTVKQDLSPEVQANPEPVKRLTELTDKEEEDTYKFLEFHSKIKENPNEKYFQVQTSPLYHSRLSERPKSNKFYLLLKINYISN